MPGKVDRCRDCTTATTSLIHIIQVLYHIMSIPSPRNDARSTRSSTSSHMRRPSIPISPTLSPRIVPVPIPQRHGSLASRSRPSVEVGSFGSVFSSSLPTGDPGSLLHNEEWLDTPVGEVLNHGKERCPVVLGDKGTEEAVDVGG